MAKVWADKLQHRLEMETGRLANGGKRPFLTATIIVDEIGMSAWNVARDPC